ncbi:hypothetical protein Tco_0758101 [Tanacetum coccineum]
MLAPKCSTFNGRPTFANPMYHKKAQSGPATRLIPDSEEILTLADKSRSKLNKDLVKPFDYTKDDSLAFIHELKKEMHADLKYVESLEDELDELESDKAEFSNMYDMLLQECVSKDVIPWKLTVLHKSCSELTDFVSKEIYTELLQRFARLEKHSISLEIALQECQVRLKNDTVCKEKASNVFRKEREQYVEIQDLKAQLQDKNMAISELKKLVAKCKGKSVDTKFDKPSVVRQPKCSKTSKTISFRKTGSFFQTPEETIFCKEKDGMYRIASNTTQTRAPQLNQTFRNTNPCASTSTGVAHKTNVSRPQPRSNQMKDKVVQYTSHAKLKKTVPISTRKPKRQANKSVATPLENIGNTETTTTKFQELQRMLYQKTSKAWKWWIAQQCPSSYTWVPKTQKKWVPRTQKKWVPKTQKQWIVQLILFIVDSGCTPAYDGQCITAVQFLKAKRSSSVKDCSKFKRSVEIASQGLMWSKAVLLASMEEIYSVNPTRAYYNGSYTSKDTKDPSWSTSFMTRRTQKSTSGGIQFLDLVPQRQKASDYDNPDPAPELQNVSPSADTTFPSQQESDLLFGPLYDEFFNDGTSYVTKFSSPIDNSIQKDTPP